MVDVTLRDSAGLKIAGTFVPVKNATSAVLIIHGLDITRKHRIVTALSDKLVAANIATLSIDLYGHGESEGDFSELTTTRAVDDVLAGIAYLKKKGFSSIGLIGMSFGGLASSIATAQSSDIDALGLLCPVSDLVATAKNNPLHYAYWKITGSTTQLNRNKVPLKFSFITDGAKNNGYDAALNIRVPTLIVHGDADNLVPCKQSKKMASLIPDCTLEMLNGVNHYFREKEPFEKAVELLSKFLIARIGGK